MEYKIVKATANIGQIEVLYSHAGIDLGVYAIDVPIVDGAYLTGDALHEEIMHRAPIWVAEREQDVTTAAGFEQIEALVEVPPAPTPEEIANAEMWGQVQFQKAVAKTLVKFGLLQSDPTEIGVTKL